MVNDDSVMLSYCMYVHQFVYVVSSIAISDSIMSTL